MIRGEVLTFYADGLLVQQSESPLMAECFTTGSGYLSRGRKWKRAGYPALFIDLYGKVSHYVAGAKLTALVAPPLT